jgi:hypothetical protein
MNASNPFHGKIKTPAGKQLRRGTGAAHPAVRFAEGLRTRYALGRWGFCRLPDLELQRRGAGVVFQFIRRDGDWQISPTLNLLMLQWKSGKEPAPRPAWGAPQPPREMASETNRPGLRRRATVTQTVEMEELIRYVTASRVRTESFPEIPPDTPTLSNVRGERTGSPFKVADRQLPVTLLRRSSLPAPAQAAEIIQRNTRPSAEPERHKVSVTAHHLAPETAIDIGKLTDGVIRAIDRRIIAQRERLGRL